MRAFLCSGPRCGVRDVSSPDGVDISDIARYHLGVPDLLIRDVPAEDRARIDALAARQGLSRTKYLRRRLHQEASRADVVVTLEDLQRLAEQASDLADPEVMRQAWS